MVMTVLNFSWVRSRSRCLLVGILNLWWRFKSSTWTPLILSSVWTWLYPSHHWVRVVNPTYRQKVIYYQRSMCRHNQIKSDIQKDSRVLPHEWGKGVGPNWKRGFRMWWVSVWFLLCLLRNDKTRAKQKTKDLFCLCSIVVLFVYYKRVNREQCCLL